MKKFAIFLDRDGVINRKPKDHDYVKSWNEFQWLLDAKEAIKLINQSGYLVIVISNQRGVARSLMDSKDVDNINSNINQDLIKIGAKIDRFYWCGHNYVDDCNCRKPKPGLIFQAAKDYEINLQKSWVIGDSDDDIAAGKLAGCKTFKIKTDGSLIEVINKILK